MDEPQARRQRTFLASADCQGAAKEIYIQFAPPSPSCADNSHHRKHEHSYCKFANSLALFIMYSTQAVETQSLLFISSQLLPLLLPQAQANTPPEKTATPKKGLHLPPCSHSSRCRDIREKIQASSFPRVWQTSRPCDRKRQEAAGRLQIRRIEARPVCERGARLG